MEDVVEVSVPQGRHIPAWDVSPTIPRKVGASPERTTQVRGTRICVVLSGLYPWHHYFPGLTSRAGMFRPCGTMNLSQLRRSEKMFNFPGFRESTALLMQRGFSPAGTTHISVGRESHDTAKRRASPERTTQVRGARMCVV